MGQLIRDLLGRSVRGFMTPDPAAVHPSQRLSVARHAMIASGGHHVPVVDEGRFVGLLAPSDLLRVLPPDAYAKDPDALDRTLDRIELRNAMQEDVLTIAPEGTVRDACEKLSRGGFHCLPVVDAHGRLIGMVTTSDLIRALLEADDD